MNTPDTQPTPDLPPTTLLGRMFPAPEPVATKTISETYCQKCGQADDCAERLLSEQIKNASAEAQLAELRALLKRAEWAIIEHHSYDIMKEEHCACPFCSGPKGNAVLTDIQKAIRP